jgi:hypothetical protein
LGAVLAILMIFSVITGMSWGIVGVAIAYTVVYSIWLVAIQIILKKMIFFDNRKFFIFLFKNFLIATGASLTIAVFKIFIHVNSLGTFFCSLIFGLLIYLILLAIFREIIFKGFMPIPRILHE